MMCCAIAALLMAAIASMRGVARRALAILPWAQWAAASLAVMFVLAGGTALMAQQINRAHGQTDLSAFLMQHICGQGPQRHIQ